MGQCGILKLVAEVAPRDLELLLLKGRERESRQSCVNEARSAKRKKPVSPLFITADAGTTCEVSHEYGLETTTNH